MPSEPRPSCASFASLRFAAIPEPTTGGAGAAPLDCCGGKASRAAKTADSPGKAAFDGYQRPPLAQHVHAQVEECTCGPGPACFCLGVAGAATPAAPAHGARAGASPAPGWHLSPLAAGLLGGLGIFFGLRAFAVNRGAAARVAESLKTVESNRLAVGRAMQAADAWSAGKQLSGEDPQVQRLLAARSERLTRLEATLTRSLRERWFEQWVPGALQAAASSGMLLTNLPLPMLAAAQPGLLVATAALWAAFAVAYAAAAALHCQQDLRRLRAAPPKGIGAAGLGRFGPVAGRALEFALWSSFALAAGHAALPAQAAWQLGARLGHIGLWNGLAATLWSNVLRAPTHTPTAPFLRQAPLWRAPEKSLQALALVGAQQAALAEYVQQATAGFAAPALKLKGQLAWEAATQPRCGPNAFAAVASRAATASASEPLGERALAQAVVQVLAAEQALLSLPADDEPFAAGGVGASCQREPGGAGIFGPAQPDAAPAASAPDQTTKDEDLPGAAAGNRTFAALLAARLALAAPERQAEQSRRARQEALQPVLRAWECLARGERLASEPGQAAEQRAGDQLRRATLQVMGLEGELLLRTRRQQPTASATIPGLSELPFLHLEALTSEAAPQSAGASQQLRRDFVRLFCAPHRLEEAARYLAAERADWSSARQAEPPKEAPGCAACER